MNNVTGTYKKTRHNDKQNQNVTVTFFRYVIRMDKKTYKKTTVNKRKKGTLNVQKNDVDLTCLEIRAFVKPR